MVCTSLGILLRPLFYFLRSNLKANPVGLCDTFATCRQSHNIRLALYQINTCWTRFSSVRPSPRPPRPRLASSPSGRCM